MSKLKARHNVANGIDIGDAGVQAIVGDNKAPIYCDAGFFVSKPLGNRASTNCDEQDICVEVLSIFGRNVRTPDASWAAKRNACSCGT